jgi:hypothetical protein
MIQEPMTMKKRWTSEPISSAKVMVVKITSIQMNKRVK